MAPAASMTTCRFWGGFTFRDNVYMCAGNHTNADAEWGQDMHTQSIFPQWESRTITLYRLSRTDHDSQQNLAKQRNNATHTHDTHDT